MHAFEQSLTRSLFDTPVPGQTVHVGGGLTSARMGKAVGFLVLVDGSSTEPLQVVVSRALMEQDPTLRTLGAGCSVSVTGTFVASRGGGQQWEVQAQTVTVTGRVEDPETYPIQPKELSPEFLRTLPHLRARTTRHGAVARLRHVLARAVHDYLDSQGFLWVATPVLSPTDAEGAGEQFQVVTTEGPTAFFGEEMFLAVSGQLDVEAFCMALSRVYTFGPTFRAEKSQTSRHLAEFWMVEPEMAFARLDDIAGLAEGLLRHAIQTVLADLPGEMAWFEKEGGRPVAAWTALAQTPFCRMTYTDAVACLQESGRVFDVPVVWGMDLQSAHEKALVDIRQGPVVVTDYPAGIKAFYMKASADGQTVAAMDILVPGMGEIVGGSEREEDFDRLTARMQSLGMDIGAFVPYLDLRRYGTVPHAGFGLGFERLVAWLSTTPSIRDAIPVPRFYKG